LPVATTAKAIATGMMTAKMRTPSRAVAWKSTIPTSRFQPACRLGNAAYTFVRAGGCSARYPWEYAVTVSKYSACARRGGATGKNALAALGDPADPEVGERGAEHEPQLTRDGLRTIRPSAALLRQRMQG
jgi:hypothetical protein